MRKKKRKNGLLIVVILLTGLFGVWTLFQRLKKRPSGKRQKRSSNQAEIERNSRAILSVVQPTKYSKYGPWIVAMARHESGNFTSELFEKNLNAFGMGIPKKRKFLGQPSTLIVEGQPMAKYNSIQQSTLDLLELFKFNNFPTNLKSVNQFAGELKADGYYTDTVSNYSRALRSFLPRDQWNLPDVKVSQANLQYKPPQATAIKAISTIDMPSLYNARSVNVFQKSSLGKLDCDVV